MSTSEMVENLSSKTSLLISKTLLGTLIPQKTKKAKLPEAKDHQTTPKILPKDPIQSNKKERLHKISKKMNLQEQ